MANWDFQLPTTLGIVFGIVCMVVVILAAGLSWRRGHLGWKDAILFGLRILVVGLIAFTLIRPERVTKQKLDRSPELVILTDDTGSMATRDVITDTSIISREEWLQQQMRSEFWKKLDSTYRIHFDKLSAYSKAEEFGPDVIGSNLNEALLAQHDRFKNLRAILVLSDGDWNLGGTPLAAATKHATQQTHIYPIAIGSESFLPDIELVDAKVQAFCILGESVVVPFRIQSRLKGDVRTTVKLLSSRGDLAQKEILLPAGQVVNDQVLWQAESLGEQDLTLSVPVEDEERIKDNNERKFKISVRKELLKVLVVDSYPRWEYRFLRNALVRDPGVEVSCLLLQPKLGLGGGYSYINEFPKGKDEISDFDVIFLGDIGLGKDQLKAEDLKLIKGVVERQGSGLVFLPGFRGKQATLVDSVLEPMIPVELDPAKPKGTSFRTPSQLLLTRLGSDHLLTMLTNSPASNRLLWRNLPGFYWNAPVLRAKPGADVLAVHGSQRNKWGRIPLLVTQPYGNGNVLFMGTDGAWRWRRGVEDTYHYRFWGQVVRWMAHPRHLSHDRGIRVFYTPENPKQGDTVFFQATVFDKNGYPLTEGEVLASIETPNKKKQQVTLNSLQSGWGVYSGDFPVKESGKYRLTVKVPDQGYHLTTEILGAVKTLERIGVPARHSTLRDLARISGGEFANSDGLDSIIEKLRLLPKEETLIRRYPLWSKWWWAAIILILLTIYWTLRKAWGLV